MVIYIEHGNQESRPRRQIHKYSVTRNIQPRTYKFNLVEIFKIIYQVTVVFLLLCRIRVVSLSFRLVYNSRNLGFSYLLQIALDNRSHIGLVDVPGQSD